MNAKDLRIGNLIEWPPDHVRPVHSCTLRLIESGLLKPSPVVITEEWLLKLGFKKNLNTFNYEEIQVHLDYPIAIGICGEKRALKPNVYFVHQLQNLYHAITGLELELKQPAQ